MTSGRTVVLASGSPRRRELVRALDLDVKLVDSPGDETPRVPGETPGDFVVRQSLDKARAAADGIADAVVIGADTTVALDGRLLGKPADKAEATEMLRALRAREHRVLTGVTVLDAASGRRLSTSKATTVLMRAYSDDEVEAYVASGGPMDKAGAYAVQDERFRPAAEVRGCYLNVIGLPLCELAQLLDAMGIQSQVRHDWPLPTDCLECPLAQRREGVQG
ncbi:MAG: septum formation protein Maf [Chloroflexi bacterium]|nr:septum formation protein Maf [Chloroflexota bacterium]